MSLAKLLTVLSELPFINYRRGEARRGAATMDTFTLPARSNTKNYKRSRDPVQHSLKCWPQFFDPISAGEKTHDLRRADDRDFRVGDILLLREFDPGLNVYTGRTLKVLITYITSADQPCALSNRALHPDYCILSIKKL